MMEIRYVNHPAAFLSDSQTKIKPKVELLLGSRLHVDTANNVNGWMPATPMRGFGKPLPKTRFIHEALITDRQQLKVFYLDVGQGDATLIEAEGAVIVIDGGPNKGFGNVLLERFKSLQQADIDIGLPARQKLRINAVIISHFDLDHYAGLTKVLNAMQFEFGAIYHNGLPRYGDPADKDLDLGQVSVAPDGSRSISTDLRDIESARKLVASGQLKTKKGNLNKFGKFLDAAVKAFDDGRLGKMDLRIRRKPGGAPVKLPDTGPDIDMEVLAPVTTKQTGAIRLPAFPDPHKVSMSNPHPSPSSSHTINGNSVVLRLTYGDMTFLFGGDLNQPAQKYLKEKYHPANPFTADVNKACHHGSSDFDVDFLKAILPHATVFSSGDDGTYDHPLPDAIGAAARHSQGTFPLVFSTELARETSRTAIKFGHINARSNGEMTIMAQKKEKPSLAKTWYSYRLPFTGPFGPAH